MKFLHDIIFKTETLNQQIPFEEKVADVHIAFGVDKNFVRGMGVLISSIGEHNPEEKIIVHVFTDYIEVSDKVKLQKLTEIYHFIIKIYYVNIVVFENLPTTIAWSIATYYRFIMGQVLYKKVDRVLYLDADILCIGSLSPIKDFLIKDNIVLAIAEDGISSVERLSLQQGRYFNAGVLYIDINKWNEYQIAEKAIEMLHSNPKRYPYLDQDVLNILLDNKTAFIDKCWNYLYDMRKMNSKLPQNVILIHFIGDKPWQEWSQHHFMVSIYHKYMKKSLWNDAPLTLPVLYKEKRRMAKSYRRRGKYLSSVLWYIKYFIAKLKK